MADVIRRLAVFRMARPGNLLVVVAGVFVGAWLVPDSSVLPGVRVQFAACAAALVAAAANIHNDIVDLPIDSINRPERPLPAGSVTLGQAWLTASVALVAAIVCSSMVSGLHVAGVVVIAVLLAAYNLKLKHLPMVGNVVVGVVVSATILYGALAAEHIAPQTGSRVSVGVLVAALFALLLTLAREIVKDLQDLKGDAEHRSRSLPHTVGSGTARWLAWAVVAITLCIIPLPYVYFGFPGLYLLVVFPATCCLLVVLLILARKHGDAASGDAYGWSSALLKLSMVIGLAALALSSGSL